MIIGIIAVAVLGVAGVGGYLLLRGGADDTAADAASTTSSELNQAVDDLSDDVRGSGDTGDETNQAPAATLDVPTPEAPTPGAEQSVFELVVGDCFNSPETSQQINSVAILPCMDSHQSEVYHSLTYEEGGETYPGAEVLESFAEDICQGAAFSDYVGTDYLDSRFFSSELTPTAESWAQGDREILCILYDVTTPLESSVRGSGQ